MLVELHELQFVFLHLGFRIVMNDGDMEKFVRAWRRLHAMHIAEDAIVEHTDTGL